MVSMKTRHLFFIFPLAIIIYLFWPAQLTDEQQIRMIILTAQKGLKNKNIEDLVSPIADSYSDNEGLDRQMIYGMAYQQFKKRGPLNLSIGEIQVELDEESATAFFDVGLIEGNTSQFFLLPEDGDSMAFEVDFQKQDDEWKVISHRRERN